jgi:hypothetical protein
MVSLLVKLGDITRRLGCIVLGTALVIGLSGPPSAASASPKMPSEVRVAPVAEPSGLGDMLSRAILESRDRERALSHDSERDGFRRQIRSRSCRRSRNSPG